MSGSSGSGGGRSRRWGFSKWQSGDRAAHPKVASSPSATSLSIPEGANSPETQDAPRQEQGHVFALRQSGQVKAHQRDQGLRRVASALSPTSTYFSVNGDRPLDNSGHALKGVTSHIPSTSSPKQAEELKRSISIWSSLARKNQHQHARDQPEEHERQPIRGDSSARRLDAGLGIIGLYAAEQPRSAPSELTAFDQQQDSTGASNLDVDARRLSGTSSLRSLARSEPLHSTFTLHSQQPRFEPWDHNAKADTPDPHASYITSSPVDYASQQSFWDTSSSPQRVQLDSQNPQDRERQEPIAIDHVPSTLSLPSHSPTKGLQSNRMPQSLGDRPRGRRSSDQMDDFESEAELAAFAAATSSLGFGPDLTSPFETNPPNIGGVNGHRSSHSGIDGSTQQHERTSRTARSLQRVGSSSISATARSGISPARIAAPLPPLPNDFPASTRTTQKDHRMSSSGVLRPVLTQPSLPIPPRSSSSGNHQPQRSASYSSATFIPQHNPSYSASSIASLSPSRSLTPSALSSSPMASRSHISSQHQLHPQQQHPEPLHPPPQIPLPQIPTVERSTQQPYTHDPSETQLHQTQQESQPQPEHQQHQQSQPQLTFNLPSRTITTIAPPPLRTRRQDQSQNNAFSTPSSNPISRSQALAEALVGMDLEDEDLATGRPRNSDRYTNNNPSSNNNGAPNRNNNGDVGIDAATTNGPLLDVNHGDEIGDDDDDELPDYATSQMEYAQRQRWEAAMRARELDAAWRRGRGY